MAINPKKPSDKTVFVIESDPERQKEIRESMSHQQHWGFEFFSEARECMAQVKRFKPLAIFLDLLHFDKISDEKYGFGLIDKFKEASPESEVIVFSESDNEQWAAESLRHGALDYIMFNPHQYVKMEYELQWLETIKDRQSEDKKFIRNLVYVLIGLVIFIFLLVLLYQMGYLKEGTSQDVLI
jgi:response regulator of citrate/malate metabolism